MADQKLKKSEAIRNLAALRDKIASRTGVENFKVLQYKTIEAIASVMPETLDELAKIKGIGPKKLGQLGRLILEAIHSETGKAGGNNNELRSKKLEVRSMKYEAGRTNGEVSIAKEGQGSGGEGLFDGLIFDKKRIMAAKNDEQTLTVSEYLNRVNDNLAADFGEIKIRGEVSGLNEHPSGIYFSLLDKADGSVLSCYMPPGVYNGLGLPLTDGLEVKAGGLPSVWKPKGRFSLRVETLELVGEGSLKKAYEMLKKKLEAEGLFIRKRPLPEFIKTAGVVTSRTGAVIHDFQKNLAKLGFTVKLYDVRVEGAKAAGEIAAAVSWFNRHASDFDVLVVMRGGGSLEDLQAFNNEIVVREIFASRIPTIAAIGHDRDVPIAALVADLAVSTPTAAAVAVNGTWRRLIEVLPKRQQDLNYVFAETCAAVTAALNALSGKLTNHLRSLAVSYQKLITGLERGSRLIGKEIAEAKETCALAAVKIAKNFDNSLREYHDKISSLEKTLTGSSPERNLKLGYSIVFNKQGKVVKNATEVKVGESIRTKLHDGELDSTVDKIIK